MKCCLTLKSTIFQSYIWRHIEVQTVWGTRLTYLPLRSHVHTHFISFFSDSAQAFDTGTPFYCPSNRQRGHSFAHWNSNVLCKSFLGRKPLSNNGQIHYVIVQDQRYFVESVTFYKPYINMHYGSFYKCATSYKLFRVFMKHPAYECSMEVTTWPGVSMNPF